MCAVLRVRRVRTPGVEQGARRRQDGRRFQLLLFGESPQRAWCDAAAGQELAGLRLRGQQRGLNAQTFLDFRSRARAAFLYTSTWLSTGLVNQLSG